MRVTTSAPTFSRCQTLPEDFLSIDTRFQSSAKAACVPLFSLENWTTKEKYEVGRIRLRYCGANIVPGLS